MILFCQTVRVLLFSMVLTCFVSTNTVHAEPSEAIKNEFIRLFENENYEEAFALASKVLEKEGRPEAAQEAIVLSNLMGGKWNQAIASSTRLIKMNPNAHSYWLRVYPNAALHRFDDVIADCEKILVLRPEDSSALVMQAIANMFKAHDIQAQDSLKSKYYYEKAIAQCNEILLREKVETCFYIFIIRGNCYEYSGDFERAIKDYHTALELANESYMPICHYMLGRCYYNQGSKAFTNNQPAAKCLAYIEQGLTHEPDNWHFYHLRGRVHYHWSNYSNALADYDMALELSDEKADLYGCRALMLEELCRYKDAIDDAKAAIRLDKSGDWAPHMHRVCGAAYLSLGQQEEALGHYSLAIENTSPAPAELFFARSTCNRLLDQIESAESDYKKGMQILQQDSLSPTSPQMLAKMKERVKNKRENPVFFFHMSWYMKLSSPKYMEEMLQTEIFSK